MEVSHPFRIQIRLTTGRQSGANYPDHAFFTLRPDDEDQAAAYGTDRDETVFVNRVSRIEDLKIVCARIEESPGLFERDAVAALIGDVLRLIPLKSYETSI